MAGGQSALLTTPIHPLNGLGVCAVQGNEPGPARHAPGFGKVRQVDGSARLTGPVAGPPVIIMTGFDLGQAAYTLEEFFLESTATRFELAGPAGADGYWRVTPAGQAPFTTRLVVCRPSDPGAYTGTVILEWLPPSASTLPRTGC